MEIMISPHDTLQVKSLTKLKAGREISQRKTGIPGHLLNKMSDLGKSDSHEAGAPNSRFFAPGRETLMNFKINYRRDSSPLSVMERGEGWMRCALEG
jgi:hypothetical protein